MPLHDIRILGTGEATLDGGAWTRENRPEYYHEQAPEEYPDGCDYDLISLFNVRNFEVANLCITNAKHYSTCFTFCRFGRIHDLHFRNYATVENQDGIDLRYGCEFITIENITGVTGDCKFDENGDAIKNSAVIKTVTDGKFTYVDTVVVE